MKTGDLVTRDGGGVGSEETSREGSACDGNLMGNGRGHDDDGGGGTVEYGTIGEGRVDAECSGISAVSGGGEGENSGNKKASCGGSKLDAMV